LGAGFDEGDFIRGEVEIRRFHQEIPRLIWAVEMIFGVMGLWVIGYWLLGQVGKI